MLPNLKDLSKEEYQLALKSGMFWEYYPEATGSYYEDVEKNKQVMTPIEKIELFNKISGNLSTKRSLKDALPYTYFSLICEEMDELVEAYDDEDLEETVDACVDICVVAIGMLYSLGINPTDALDEVCDANLSKFCNTVNEADASVLAYEHDNRYFDVHYVEIGDKLVIKGRKVDAPDGDYKILKGVNTRKPSFKHLL